LGNRTMRDSGGAFWECAFALPESGGPAGAFVANNWNTALLHTGSRSAASVESSCGVVCF